MKTTQKQENSANRPSNHSKAEQLNKYAHCEFTLHISRNNSWDEDSGFDAAQPHTVTYGFETVTFWNPKTQKNETPDPTRFRVTADTFELAKSEFWIRYSNYCYKRWGYRAIASSVYSAPNAKNDTYTSFQRHTRNNGAQ